MAVKSGNIAVSKMKAGRGLAHDSAAYLSRGSLQFVVIPAVIDVMIGQSLTPGQETEVLVPVSGLQANADVKQIKVTLVVSTDTGTSPPPNTLYVKEGQGAERTFEVSAKGPPGLSNITVRLDPGEIFWTYAGLLAPGSHPIPVDFSAQANAYLDQTAHGAGTVALKFMIKSDSPGRVRIQIDILEFTLLQTQTWPNELDGTLRTDRNINLDFNSEERLLLTPIAPIDGHAPVLAQVRMDVSGQLGPERLLESLADPAHGEFCTISSEYSLARGFILNPDVVKGGSVQCVGFSAYLHQDAEAEIYAELQVDAAPSPNREVASGSTLASALTNPASGAPLAKASLVITPLSERQVQPNGRWVFVRLESAADLRVGLPYWLVIRGIRGQVYLGLRPAAEQAVVQAIREEHLRINRGGQLWKPLQRGTENSIRSRLALVYLPSPDNNMAAVSVSIETPDSPAGADSALVDPGTQTQTLSIALNKVAPTKGAILVVRSNAAGAFTVANVIQEYRSV